MLWRPPASKRAKPCSAQIVCIPVIEKSRVLPAGADPIDLVVFENNKPWVIDEFREGRFDYVELASDVAETKFFQFLFGQQVVDSLRPPDLRIAWVD